MWGRGDFFEIPTYQLPAHFGRKQAKGLLKIGPYRHKRRWYQRRWSAVLGRMVRWRATA